MPTDEALDLIGAASTAGVVEIGAGTGYWAAMLAANGVDVLAYDIAPAPSADNHLFEGRDAWFPVAVGDEAMAASHPDRTLLLVWPTYDEAWPAEAIERFHDAGGQRLAFVGQGPGGVTGDVRFHALVGNLDRCYPCALGVAGHACTCDVQPMWRCTHQSSLPSWGEDPDRLQIFERIEDPEQTPLATERSSPVAGGGCDGRPSGLTALRELGVLGQVWTLTVIGFCVARAVVVWPLLRRYGVNPWWFLAIDIGTAPMYGLGQAMGVKLIRDATRPMRDALPWIAALLVAFVAPYAYLLASAGKLPTYVILGVALWIVVFGAFAVGRLFRDARRQSTEVA
ncbi:hypothetical protein KSP35_20110 [Aquihabitans sp. G128]|uniref:hypothetical protein n=1 Tax=Aquihabitans sp. G128 TaxID=2849779 RepID=UPI001C232DCD|nr:hypothetical protein [Aquihabitans sp. G128]QXC60600.1 hypothetical protein KSP35_20110 [Aquihabitans sp. G128]